MMAAGAVLPVLKNLYTVAHNSSYDRDSHGKKSQPKVVRAKLDGGGTIVGAHLSPPLLASLFDASAS